MSSKKIVSENNGVEKFRSRLYLDRRETDIAELKAGTSVRLKPGFRAFAGSSFRAFVDANSFTPARFYYLKDHLGSTRVTVNEKGDKVSYDDYDPWGMQLDGRSGNLASAFDKYKFTGKERDVETGYDYFGARYYDSRIARWMQVDPMAEKYPGWSPYNYVKNNPMILIDPDGEKIVINYKKDSEEYKYIRSLIERYLASGAAGKFVYEYLDNLEAAIEIVLEDISDYDDSGEYIGETRGEFSPFVDKNGNISMGRITLDTKDIEYTNGDPLEIFAHETRHTEMAFNDFDLFNSVSQKDKDTKYRDRFWERDAREFASKVKKEFTEMIRGIFNNKNKINIPKFNTTVYTH